MEKRDQDAKNRIIKATTEILDEVSSIDKITVRQIAERANVGVGLINYYFQTKDNLLSLAIGNEMTQVVDSFIQTGSGYGPDPVEKIKRMLKELFSYGERHKEFMKYLITHSLINGDVDAQLTLMPIIREIFGDKKDEMQLRIIAQQILLPLQVTVLSPSAFLVYSGINLLDEVQRNKYIDILVDNLVK